MSELIDKLKDGVPLVGLHEDNNTEMFDVEEASDTMSEAADEIARLKAVIEADRSEVAEATQELRKTISGTSWLLTGRGSYEWDDDAYRREFGAAVLSMEKDIEPLRRLAGDWTDCPSETSKIKAAREARNQQLKSDK